MCVLENRCVIKYWITILDDSHPKVLEYIKAKNADIMVYEADKGDWMQPIWTTL